LNQLLAQINQRKRRNFKGDDIARMNLRKRNEDLSAAKVKACGTGG
jgi:hypothetical protein